jgi:hypothetical protein
VRTEQHERHDCCYPKEALFSQCRSMPSRTIRTTETFWGLTLKLYLLPNLYDVRLNGYVRAAGEAAQPQYVAQLDYSQKWQVISGEEQWRAAIHNQPLQPQQRRHQMLQFLRAKMQHEEPAVQVEGLHGVLELCINPRHHSSMDAGAPPPPHACMLHWRHAHACRAGDKPLPHACMLHWSPCMPHWGHATSARMHAALEPMHAALETSHFRTHACCTGDMPMHAALETYHLRTQRLRMLLAQYLRMLLTTTTPEATHCMWPGWPCRTHKSGKSQNSPSSYALLCHHAPLGLLSAAPGQFDRTREVKHLQRSAKQL